MIEKDLNKFIKKTENKFTNLLRNVCLELSYKICERTGVDTGYLLGTYRIGINRPGVMPSFKPGPSSWIKEGNTFVKDKSIEAKNKERAFEFTLSRVLSTVSRLNYTDSFYFDTIVNYADMVEYIGWNRTPPYRMFGRTIIDFQSIVIEEANKVKNV